MDRQLSHKKSLLASLMKILQKINHPAFNTSLSITKIFLLAFHGTHFYPDTSPMMSQSPESSWSPSPSLTPLILLFSTAVSPLSVVMVIFILSLYSVT
uniref:Uncharacterized protein n=1 Tax=Chenopodium quinoa TaxID=63459 RepID=A0A803NDI5_CHEQI